MQFDHLEARIYWTYMFKLHLRIPLFEYSIKEVLRKLLSKVRKTYIQSSQFQKIKIYAL